ncbi:MAG: hypothetical protein JST79_02105 [Acidobacteria bacterium]|nr:hypothetical protein [Acidobacteriota bacterium]
MSAPDPAIPEKARRARHVPSIQFQDAAAAAAALRRILPRLSDSLAAALPELLSESPDPDSALIFLERFLQQCSGSLQMFERNHALAHYALLVGGHSRYLSETLIQGPELLPALIKERNLDRSFSHEDFEQSLARFRTRGFESDISLLLARFKKREYIRIMLRDVLKLAPLAETTAEISALTDVLISDAWREAGSRLQRRFGSPQHVDAAGRLADTPFTVLSLGKLGGNELNYNSDVDLLYIFGGGQEPLQAPLSNREYFIRLAQEVTGILSQLTREGAVFRIDLRLRPQGNEGELAISLPHALQYYAARAHDWEKQALIKLRYSAGDRRLARDFLHGVQQWVYTEEVNFAAVKTALSAREKILQHRLHQPGLGGLAQGTDVKIDAGGIRDIEFLVQCLQRVYGGKEPWLRSRGTLFALQKLHDKGHISGKEFHELSCAYEFLRHLEHRMQLRQGQQTHRLPSEGPELLVLQRAMEGYTPGEDQVLDLPAAVRQRMAEVTEIYQRVVYHQNVRSQADPADGAFELHNAPEAGLAEQSNQQILERLSLDAPALYELAGRSDLSAQARRNLFRFLSAAFTSSERYAAVVRQPEAVAYALPLFEVSDYLTDILVRHPAEITTLSDLRHSAGGGESALFDAAGDESLPPDPVFDYLAIPGAAPAEKLALLRQHYRHRMFEAGAKDLAALRDVGESLQETSHAADGAIAAAFGIAGAPAGLAVLAVGRLGSSEFDLLSDADLIFVCQENADRLGLNKAAEQLMQTLSAYTRDGMVFPVDGRLRPHGSQGELLMCPAQFETYLAQEAQPWESLMYSKARWVAGSPELAARVLASREALFQKMAADVGFSSAVCEMRSRLETPEEREINLKTSPGGAYDLDFLAAYLHIRHQAGEKNGSLRARLARCVSAGWISGEEGKTLDAAAELLRTVEHIVRLVVGRARKSLPANEHACQLTEKLTAQILGREFAEGLEAELRQTMQAVRTIFSRYIPA